MNSFWKRRPTQEKKTYSCARFLCAVFVWKFHVKRHSLSPWSLQPVFLLSTIRGTAKLHIFTVFDLETSFDCHRRLTSSVKCRHCLSINSPCLFDSRVFCSVFVFFRFRSVFSPVKTSALCRWFSCAKHIFTETYEAYPTDAHNLRSRTYAFGLKWYVYCFRWIIYQIRVLGHTFA